MFASQIEQAVKALEEKLKYFSELNISGAERENPYENKDKKRD